MCVDVSITFFTVIRILHFTVKVCTTYFLIHFTSNKYMFAYQNLGKNEYSDKFGNRTMPYVSVKQIISRLSYFILELSLIVIQNMSFFASVF